MMDFEQLPLRDIHLPDAVSWWPLGLGWWALLALAVFVLLVAVWWRSKTASRRRRKRLVREARSELSRLDADYAVEDDATTLLRRISALIRRVGMTLDRRQSVAGLCAEEWGEWLRRSDVGNNLSEDALQLLVRGPYRRVPDGDVASLIGDIGRWLNALPKWEPADDPV